MLDFIYVKVIIQTKEIFEDDTSLSSSLEEIFASNSDFVFIKPKDNSYKIEEIRNFTSKLNSKQTENTKNLFYILTKGDELSPVCQNALLKTLEESPYSIGILVKNQDSLLPTIKSRCQIKQLKINNEKLKGTASISNISSAISELASISKPDRNEIITKLENMLDMLYPEELPKAEYIQNAINKLSANCKVESVLIELEDLVKSS